MGFRAFKGLGFRVLGFGFRILGFGFRVLVLGSSEGVTTREEESLP